jgi:two-component system OmpR family response regulator
VPFRPPKPIQPAPDDVRQASIMVVDDERTWRVIMETDLRLLGYRISVATNGAEALERAASERPEAAIVDLMLPEPMDGWALLRELRARALGISVIFYTAYPVFPDLVGHPEVVGCVSKATDRADLYALLPGAIRRSREQRATNGSG